MDGEQARWAMRDVFQANVPMIDILDLLHVTPRLWDAATLFHPKGSRAAEEFVRQRVTRILQGDVRGVVRGLRWMGPLRGCVATNGPSCGRSADILKGTVIACVMTRTWHAAILSPAA